MCDLFEEGEFDNCADVLDDWFNSCNIQGTAKMETVEVDELLECMRDIENRKSTTLQAKVRELESAIGVFMNLGGDHPDEVKAVGLFLSEYNAFLPPLENDDAGL